MILLWGKVARCRIIQEPSARAVFGILNGIGESYGKKVAKQSCHKNRPESSGVSPSMRTPLVIEGDYIELVEDWYRIIPEVRTVLIIHYWKRWNFAKMLRVNY